MEERSYTATYGRSVVVTNSTMVETDERTQSLRTVVATHGLISGGNGGAKLVGVIIQSKLLSISRGNSVGNDGNGANSGRANLVVANTASYGLSVAATKCAMAAMD